MKTWDKQVSNKGAVQLSEDREDNPDRGHCKCKDTEGNYSGKIIN